MSDNFYPPSGGPPPLPQSPTTSQGLYGQPYGAQPASAPPPPLPAGYPPAQLGSALPPPIGNNAQFPVSDIEADAVQAPRRGNEWMIWAIPVIAVVVMGVGAVVFLAARSGPSKATAAQAPPAWTQPLPPLPTIPPNYQGSGQGSAPAVPIVPSAPTARRRRPVASAPPVLVPQLRKVDLNLKKMFELSESAGMATKTVKTLKSERSGGLVKQPVEVSVNGTFPEAVAYLQRLHEALPHALPATMEMSQDPKSPLDPAQPLPVVFKVDCYFMPDDAQPAESAEPGEDADADADADAPGASRVLPRQPELAPALVQVSKAAGGRLAFLNLSIKTAAANQVPPFIHPTITVEALALGDADVARFTHGLSRGDRLADVNLIVSEDHMLGGHKFRKCKVEVRVTDPPEGSPPPLNAAAAAPPDAFRFPAALQLKPAPAPRPGAPAQDPAAAARAAERAAATRDAQKLRLQTILAGQVKSCMINNKLYREGDEVSGFTIEEISPGTVTLQRGEHRFQIRMQK